MIDTDILDEIIPVPKLDDLKDKKIAELKAAGFAITNFHSGGIYYTLMMIVLRIKIELLELARTIANNMTLSHSSGVWLDIKANDYSKWRKQAQKTQGVVTVTRGSSQGEAIKITKGHVFKTAKDINGDELRYISTETAVLQKGATSVNVPVEAEAEGSTYNVPKGQITRSLTYIGDVAITNGESWITREGSDTEDDDSLRTRALRSWSELAQHATKDSYINVAESVPGVLFAQADCDHPRGQGTVDIIVTGTAGTATEGLLTAVRTAVAKIAGPYDNVLVKGATTVTQDIATSITTTDASSDDEIAAKIKSILTELLAVRKGRKLNELTLSDINYAIRSGYSLASNVEIKTPAADVTLGKDKVIVLGSVTVTVGRN